MSDKQFDSTFRPIPVSELLTKPYHFVIPSFQRGYRWERKQVKDLLDDIYAFSRGDHQDSYFLQPLVVKPSKNGKDGKTWEVLDGQQRLTTMLLILHRAVSKLPSDEQDLFKDSLYRITYLNRQNLDFENPDATRSLDGFYLAEAKGTIDRWFKNKLRANTYDFVKCLFYTDEKKQVNFIWYEIPADSTDLSSINVFNRLNKGKISLTSSELIKALFVLDLENHGDTNGTAAGQLVMEWNEMERKFQDDKFWYSISNEDKTVQTRIDLLFDFLTRKSDGEDSDYSYRLFQNLFDYCNAAKGASVELKPFWNEAGVDSMATAWRQIKSTFNTLVAWYEDSMFYHYVGFLVNEKSTPLSVYTSLQKAKDDILKKEPSYEWTRDDSEKCLKSLIKDKFKTGNNPLTKDGIDKLEYSNSDIVRRVLLLFNIELCIKTGNQRFAFDRFKKEKWDIEHVDSQNDADLQKPEDRILWLRNIVMILQMEQCSTGLLEECSNHLTAFDKQIPGERSFPNNLYEYLYKKVNRYFSFDAAEDKSIDQVDLNNKNKDSINNLTLLNSDINRSYKDAPFPYKRFFIIQQDQDGGHFIPIGTRNLFLKYFSSSNKSVSALALMRWNEADKKSYLDAIHSIVDPIIIDPLTSSSHE